MGGSILRPNGPEVRLSIDDDFKAIGWNGFLWIKKPGSCKSKNDFSALVKVLSFLTTSRRTVFSVLTTRTERLHSE
jgi:hypothetical protein